jgi:uncharacterized DUF497 family protein
MPTFEWDAEKARSNYHKHGIGFEAATEIFDDPLALEFIDEANHDLGEERILIIGRTLSLQVLTVVYTERGENIRIISARKATRAEHDDYYRQSKED